MKGLFLKSDDYKIWNPLPELFQASKPYERENEAKQRTCVVRKMVTESSNSQMVSQLEIKKAYYPGEEPIVEKERL